MPLATRLIAGPTRCAGRHDGGRRVTRLISNIYSRGPSQYEAERRKRLILEQSEKAWRERGIAVIPVDELLNEWDQQAVTNIANRLYGRRLDAKS
jgi:hypothetical protein